MFMAGISKTMATPPLIITQPLSQSAVAGTNISFSVGAAGTAPLRFQWRLNGTNLHGGGVYSGVTSNVLTLKDIRSYHSGAFDVTVTNVEGSITSAPATLVLSPISWPGHKPHRQIQSMWITNGIAYLTSVSGYSGLSIMDVGDPMNAVQIGHWSVSGWVDQISVRDRYAYLNADNQLKILDVSNPLNPFLAGTFPVGGACAFGSNYLCLATGTNFLVLDASNPTNLAQIGAIAIPADRVIVEGRYAYAIGSSTASSPLSIIDLANPSNPQRVSWYDLSGWTGGFAKRGNYVFVGNQSALVVLDVRSPHNPKFVSSLYGLPSYPNDVAVYDHFVLVSCYWHGLAIVDVGDPAHPTQVAFYRTGTRVRSASGFINSVTVDGHYAHLSTDYGLQILDIQNPATPKLVGGDVQATEVAIEGTNAYVIDPLSGLHVVNIADPSRPVQVGVFDFIGYARCVAVSGTRAYVVEGDYREPIILNVLDISDPSNMGILGSCTIDAFGSSWNVDLEFEVVISGNHAFVAGGLAGLAIIDVRNSSQPVLRALLESPSVGVAIESDFAYVAPGNPGYSGSLGFSVVNVSNTTNPVVMGGWDTSVGYAYRIALGGNYAFLANGSAGVQVLNITDPNDPYRVANYPSNATDIAIRGSRAYVTGRGLSILDITSPFTPALETQFKTAGSSVALALNGNQAYVADGTWGLAIVSLPIAASPATLRNPRLTGSGFSFDVLGTTKVEYVVESCTNLSSPFWSSRTTNAAPFQFIEPAGNGPVRFYRARNM